jgi:outer membrane protein insertion porin family
MIGRFSCMPRALRRLLLALGLAAVLGSAAVAQAPGTIAEIIVEGTQRIEQETVRSYMALKPGDPFDADRMDRSLKALFATGLFADVTLRREGERLIVRVAENPIINRIAFEGNKRISTETLTPEIQLKPRIVFTRTKVQNDVKRILDLYRRQGRFAVTVEPKIIQLPQNRVDLVFEIDEGGVTAIRRISFLGNKRYGDSTLRGVISTKESAWYRFLTSDDTYDPDRIAFDREQLRRHYLNAGYADFRVVSAVAELVPERTGFYITFTLDEGQRYRWGKREIVSSLKDLSVDSLRSELAMTEGDWYSSELIDSTIRKLTDRLGTLGYAFVEVEPKTERDRDGQRVNITFEIKEGPKVFVERIDIVGNVRTLDRVVRREFRLVEGDAFNTSKMQRSRQRIQNLGFFGKVDVANQPGSAPDLTVIKATVEERSTGELSFGAGYSTTDGALGNVQLRERNLLGKGQDLRLRALLSTRRQEYDISFTEPHFLDREIAGGFDLFRITRDNQRISSYDDKRIGTGVRMGYQLSEELRHSVRYNLIDTEIRNVKSGASRFIRDQEGRRITSLIGQELLYDRRDNRFDPTEGYFLRVGFDVAGLAGDAHYLRPGIGGGYFYPVATDIVASLSGNAGLIYGLGEDVKIGDRFFIGGDNLRGFQYGGIGPRDGNTGDALGGNKFYTVTADVSFPLGLPKDIPLLGRAFVEVGSLWDIDATGLEIRDINSLRASVGVGLSIRSPVGPIRIDLAQPFIKESFDKKEVLRISLGTRF